ncbi:isoaspartyl peptidase/L-asparaginase family protein [Candidatus Nitrospira salsa]
MMSSSSNRTPRVLVHGGAGSQKLSSKQRTCLSESLVLGFDMVKDGQAALLVVEGIIRHLEKSGLFNAGLGSRQQLDGVQRMDASIMEGASLQAGAVAGLEGFCHPISVAKVVMEETDHVLLVGQYATHLARHFKLERNAVPKKTLKRKDLKLAGLGKSKSVRLFNKMTQYDTVGAVVLDSFGNLSAGASTGGVPMMLPGRVGDSPLIGSGVFADNTAGAVSMTGLGEGIMRLVMAKQISYLMKNGQSPKQATQSTLKELVTRIKGGQAGCLVLAPDGRFAIKHVTKWMSAGHWNGKGKPVVADRFS